MRRAGSSWHSPGHGGGPVVCLVAAEQVVVGGEAVVTTHHHQVISAPQKVSQTAVAQIKPGTFHSFRARAGGAGGEGGGVESGSQAGAQSLLLLLLLVLLLGPLGREDGAEQEEGEEYQDNTTVHGAGVMTSYCRVEMIGWLSNVHGNQVSGGFED